MELLQERAPTFLDFKLKSTPLIGARKKALNPGDIVTDDSNIIGIVRFESEQFGNYIEYIDGFAAYDKQKRVKKIATANEQLFLHNKKYYGFIVRLGRVMEQSLKSNFPAARMLSNGSTIFVRASTLPNITKRFVAARVGNSQSLFSVTMTPFFNAHIDTFDVKKSLRKSLYAYNVLKNFFIDIDLQMKQANRIKFTVTDSNDYNRQHWNRILRQFKKFGVRYSG